MAVHDYEQLKQHVGHEIHVVHYGSDYEYEGDLANAAVECWTCHEVLLDFDKEKANEKIT
jgi:hypothetical protein